MESADLVGPPGHRDTSPLGEEGRMVTLRLGEGADPVGEGQRVGEAREVEEPLEPGNAVAFHRLPGGDLAPELRDLHFGHPGRVAAAGHTAFGGQRAHRMNLPGRTGLGSRLRAWIGPRARCGPPYTSDSRQARHEVLAPRAFFPGLFLLDRRSTSPLSNVSGVSGVPTSPQTAAQQEAHSWLVDAPKRSWQLSGGQARCWC